MPEIAKIAAILKNELEAHLYPKNLGVEVFSLAPCIRANLSTNTPAALAQSSPGVP
jgi:hypothetical protein